MCRLTQIQRHWVSGAAAIWAGSTRSGRYDWTESRWGTGGFRVVACWRFTTEGECAYSRVEPGG